MSFDELLQWWNLIYAAPLFISLVFIAATVFAGAHGDGGHDVGHASGHGDVGHGDMGHGHDADGDSQDHGEMQHDTAFTRVLWVLGIGRIPITLLVGIFMLSWGVFGMFSNQVLAGIMKYPAIYIWPSLGVTFFASSLFTRTIAAVVGRYMPGTETYGVTRMELVGSLGTAVYAINDTSGTVNIKDVYGTVHRVQAKIESGSDVLPSGTEVIIIDFDDTDKHFIVRKSTL